MAPPHGRLSVVLAFVLTSISTLVVVLRFYTRQCLVGKLTASDWVILLALIATWLSVVINVYMVHFMEYTPTQLQNPETLEKVITGSLLSIWLYRISHILDLCLIKTSILLFYHHIAASNRRFHYIIRTLLAIIILGGISMFFASIFMCYPVSDAWSFKVFMGGLHGTYSAHCYNPGPFWLFNAIYNLVTDIIIWTLPIVFFLNLQTIPLRRRIELVAIFSIGVVAIIASALRLHTIILWLSSFRQQGLNTANLLLWSQVEQHTGLIAASMPFLRPLCRKALTKARTKEQPSSPRPAALLCRQATLGCSPAMPRTPIIPSPTFTLGFQNQEFVQPRSALAPVELVSSSPTWGSAIWDGSQTRNLLPVQQMASLPIRNSDAVAKAPDYS